MFMGGTLQSQGGGVFGGGWATPKCVLVWFRHPIIIGVADPSLSGFRGGFDHFRYPYHMGGDSSMFGGASAAPSHHIGGGASFDVVVTIFFF